MLARPSTLYTVRWDANHGVSLNTKFILMTRKTIDRYGREYFIGKGPDFFFHGQPQSVIRCRKGPAKRTDAEPPPSPLVLSENTTKLCLIHVGKSAGSRVRCELNRIRRGLPCLREGPPPPSALFRTVKGVVHMAHASCRATNAYVVVLRNPLDRIRSWYFYEHPKGVYYELAAKQYRIVTPTQRAFYQWDDNNNNNTGCFRTLDEFARNVILPMTTAPQNETNSFHNDTASIPSSSFCQQLAWDVATGKKACRDHNHYNYAFYRNKIKQLFPPNNNKNNNNNNNNNNNTNKTITKLAIRTEHVAEDWDEIERAFVRGRQRKKAAAAIVAVVVNGTARFHNTTSRNARRTNDTDHDAVFGPTTLSDLGRRNLCAALCEEMQIYKQFLWEAQNLSPQQVHESLRELVASCPEETIEIRQCPTSR
eukprot:scaffold1204_cov179-Amphora_coffeaeformis.AAC.2